MHKLDSTVLVKYVECVFIYILSYHCLFMVSVIYLSSCVFIHTRDDELTSHLLTSVRTIHSLSVLPQLSDVIVVITDNDIGADGARHIGDSIKACRSLKTLNLRGIWRS